MKKKLYLPLLHVNKNYIDVNLRYKDDRLLGKKVKKFIHYLKTNIVYTPTFISPHFDDDSTNRREKNNSNMYGLNV